MIISPKRPLSFAILALLAAGCDGGAALPAAPRPTGLAARAERRAFDGAPPVIPHRPFGAACISCHGKQGIEVEGVGYSPPSPHEATPGLSAASHCRQCHIFRETDAVFAASDFTGLRQDVKPGSRLHPFAPPVMPHQLLLRENCAACHTGPAAREEIRCTHPERIRCEQCHAPVTVAEEFRR